LENLLARPQVSRRAVSDLLAETSWEARCEETLSCDCSRCGTSIHQFHAHGIHTQVEPFEGARAQQYEVTGLADNDLVERGNVGEMNPYFRSPAFQNGSISLTKAPDLYGIDAERLQQASWKPRQGGTCVDQRTPNNRPMARAIRVLDLEVCAKRSHVVHRNSGENAE
jgi:hypothetical protein